MNEFKAFHQLLVKGLFSVVAFVDSDPKTHYTFFVCKGLFLYHFCWPECNLLLPCPCLFEPVFGLTFLISLFVSLPQSFALGSNSWVEAFEIHLHGLSCCCFPLPLGLGQGQF